MVEESQVSEEDTEGRFGYCNPFLRNSYILSTQVSMIPVQQLVSNMVLTLASKFLLVLELLRKLTALILL